MCWEQRLQGRLLPFQAVPALTDGLATAHRWGPESSLEWPHPVIPTITLDSQGFRIYGSGSERGGLGEREALRQGYKAQQEDKGLLETEKQESRKQTPQKTGAEEGHPRGWWQVGDKDRCGAALCQPSGVHAIPARLAACLRQERNGGRRD